MVLTWLCWAFVVMPSLTMPATSDTVRVLTPDFDSTSQFHIQPTRIWQVGTAYPDTLEAYSLRLSMGAPAGDSTTFLSIWRIRYQPQTSPIDTLLFPVVDTVNLAAKGPMQSTWVTSTIYRIFPGNIRFRLYGSALFFPARP